MSPQKVTKRELLRKSGTAVAGLSVIGTASAQERDRRRKDDSSNRTDSETESGTDSGTGSGGVSTQSLEGASASFDPWEISTTEEATFDCSWNVFLPVSISAHRLDAHIEAAHIKEPDVNSVDVGRDAVKKNWEYESDPSPSGIDNPTYHFKIQKQFAGLPGSTQTIELNSEIEPTSSGDVSAWVGGQIGGGNIGNGFVGAELEIN